MVRHTGKRNHRSARFKPPQIPKADELQPHQNYGIITKYHGGANRYMDVTVFNAVTSTLDNSRCRLKGSLKHFKCRQRVIVGAYCVVDYDEVVIIFTPDQHFSIPESTYSKLASEHQVSESKASSSFNIDFMSDFDEEDEDVLPERHSYRNDEDDDIAFGAEPDSPLDQDIDTI